MTENPDPWGSSQIKDYEKMRKEFGIDKFNFNLGDRFSSRNLIIGHRDFEKVYSRISKGSKFYAMTGLMPSGYMHLGNKTIMEMMIYLQKKGGLLHIAVADLESLATRGISLEKARKTAIENFLKNYIAMGLEPCVFYFQSSYFPVLKNAFQIANFVNMTEMKDIYGFQDSKKLLEINSPIIQASDILTTMIENEILPTVVPVGADQDPHIRLTRDISNRSRAIRIIEENGSEKILSIGGNFNIEDALQIIAGIENDGQIKIRDVNRNYRQVKIESTLSAYHLDILIAEKERGINRISTITPSSIIMRLESGINGGKMSKSVPDSTISLEDKDEDIKGKIMRAVTGGRETVEEQRKLGGDPFHCPVFELYLYHMEDGKMVKQVEDECMSGSRLCGNCKKEAANLISSVISDLREKKTSLEHKVKEFEIL
ncbi:tryptophan--tRNA ligase [Caldiplasma sukawensis]